MTVSKLQMRILQSGKSQREVASECGFSPERISDYIHGGRAIPPRHLLSLCHVLEANPSDILGEQDFHDISTRKG